MKANIGGLEEEVRELFTRRLRKEFTGVVGGVFYKKSFLMRFEYFFKR